MADAPPRRSEVRAHCGVAPARCGGKALRVEMRLRVMPMRVRVAGGALSARGKRARCSGTIEMSEERPRDRERWHAVRRRPVMNGGSALRLPSGRSRVVAWTRQLSYV